MSDDEKLLRSAKNNKVFDELHEDPLGLRKAVDGIAVTTTPEIRKFDNPDAVREAINSFGKQVEAGIVVGGSLRNRVTLGKDKEVILDYTNASISTRTVQAKDGKPKVTESTLTVSDEFEPKHAKFVQRIKQIGELDKDGRGSIGTLVETTEMDPDGKPDFRSTINVRRQPENGYVTKEVEIDKDGITVTTDVAGGRSSTKSISNEEMKKEYEQQLKDLIKEGPADKSTDPNAKLPKPMVERKPGMDGP